MWNTKEERIKRRVKWRLERLSWKKERREREKDPVGNVAVDEFLWPLSSSTLMFIP